MIRRYLLNPSSAGKGNKILWVVWEAFSITGQRAETCLRKGSKALAGSKCATLVAVDQKASHATEGKQIDENLHSSQIKIHDGS